MKIIKYLFLIVAVCTMAACKHDYTGQWVSIKPDKSLKGWKTDENKNNSGYEGNTLLLTG